METKGYTNDVTSEPSVDEQSARKTPMNYSTKEELASFAEAILLCANILSRNKFHKTYRSEAGEPMPMEEFTPSVLMELANELKTFINTTQYPNEFESADEYVQDIISQVKKERTRIDKAVENLQLADALLPTSLQDYSELIKLADTAALIERRRQGRHRPNRY